MRFGRSTVVWTRPVDLLKPLARPFALVGRRTPLTGTLRDLSCDYGSLAGRIRPAQPRIKADPFPGVMMRALLKGLAPSLDLQLVRTLQADSAGDA